MYQRSFIDDYAILRYGLTLSVGRASGPWPGAGPGPALRASSVTCSPRCHNSGKQGQRLCAW